MDTTAKWVLGIAAYFGLIFFGAYGYAWSWNAVVPALYGVGTVTMLQAWVASFVVSILTARATNKDTNWAELMLSGYVRVLFVMLVALIVKTWFL